MKVEHKGFWDQKQNRAFFKIMKGFDRARILGKKARHIVLTTSKDPRVKGNNSQLYKDFKELNKRIRRMTPLKLSLLGFIAVTDLQKYYPSKPIGEHLDYQYHRVRTIEGNGVLHIVAIGDFIPYYWLSKQWEEIHSSPIVSIIEISPQNYGDRANYIVTQYVASQGSAYVRSSMSWYFVFPSWISTYNSIKNGVYHHRIRKAHRPQYLTDGWTYDWYSEAEWIYYEAHHRIDISTEHIVKWNESIIEKQFVDLVKKNEQIRLKKVKEKCR